MNVAELVVRALEAEGVEHVFGVPGEESEALLFALAKSRVQFIPTRHEQGAAFMANVWGRLTGRAGVCSATLGPGATNLLTGVADANLDRSPVVALTAQGALSRLHHESHQALDIVAMMRSITKWNTSIVSVETVSETIRKAFKQAESEKPGATHIELPEDLASADVIGHKPIPRVRRRRPAPDKKALAAVIDLIASAEQPLILAGNGAIRKLASRHLTNLATNFGLPVVSTFMGKGAVSDRLPQSLRALGLGFRDIAMDPVDASDLIIAVVYDVAELAPDSFNPDGNKPIVHIDFEPAEVYSKYQPQVELVCDISAALRAQRRTGWLYHGSKT